MFSLTIFTQICCLNHILWRLILNVTSQIKSVPSSPWQSHWLLVTWHLLCIYSCQHFHGVVTCLSPHTSVVVQSYELSGLVNWLSHPYDFGNTASDTIKFTFFHSQDYLCINTDFLSVSGVLRVDMGKRISCWLKSKEGEKKRREVWKTERRKGRQTCWAQKISIWTQGRGE